MKKLLILTFLVGISFPAYSFATGVCLIKDNSAQVLLDYIKDNRQVVKNVTKVIVKKDREEKSIRKDLEKVENETTTIFNEMFNFLGYYSYFNYFVTHPISNEVPYQVKRDYQILDRENDGLIEYIKRIDNRGNTDIVIEDACNGIKSKCELNNKTSKEIITALVKNNDKILNIYRLVIIGETNNINWGDLMLTNNNFELEFKKNYGKESVSGCNSDEGGFFEQIAAKIRDIKILNDQGKKGIGEWKKAWQLLIGNRPEEEAKIEKQVLREELSNKGISMGNQEIINNNLDKYNQEGFTPNNNFLSNTITSTYTKVNDQLRLWKEEVIGDFFDKKEVVSINDLTNATNNSKVSKDIQERITILYEDEIPFVTIGDITTENLRAKIIETHISLDGSINTLDKTIEVSQKVCTSQGGGGNCK